MYEPKMIYSDNPYIDAVVYYTKYLIVHSIIKDEEEADSRETIDSIRDGGIYINNLRLGRLRPDQDIDIINEPKYYYANSNWSHYIELNSYYRTLAGYPPIPTMEQIIDYNANYKDLKGGRIYHIDISEYKEQVQNTTGIYDDVYKYPTYLHEVSNEKILRELENMGVIENAKNEHYGDPNYEYLNYIGVDKSIPIEISRPASKFQMIYVPTIPEEDYNDIRQKFEIIYEKNRLYVMSAVYSEAMAFGNKYYDKFIIILLKVMTMMDMISDVFDYLIHKDIFDSRTIRYLFESYGVDYYSEIPTKYQIAMLKNMNTLLKYKSTNKNIVDICNLFGFDNITVFKYYLLKERKSEEIVIESDKDGNKYINNEKTYDLKFLKVPLNDNYFNYLDSASSRLSYETITVPDKFWVGIHDDLGVSDSDAVRHQRKLEILNKDFSCELTKYLSIDSTEDVAKMSADICYFYNMIFNEKRELFTVSIPKLHPTPIPVGDVFAYIISLGYTYNDIVDDIITVDFEKNMYIHGFNFNSDVDILLKDYYKNNPSAIMNEDLSGFEEEIKSFATIEGDTINSYEEFERIFINNRNLHDLLKERMDATDDYSTYKAYKKMYDSLMTTKFSAEYFGIHYQYNAEKKEYERVYLDGEPIIETYYDYLENKGYANMIRSLNEYIDMTNAEKKQQAITAEFEEIIDALEAVFKNEHFANIYNIIPTRSANFLISCLTKVISFFKSYKTQIVTMSTIYTIDDSDNGYGMLEDVDVKFSLNLIQQMNPVEYTFMTFKESFDESMEPFEKVYIKNLPSEEVNYG